MGSLTSVPPDVIHNFRTLCSRKGKSDCATRSETMGRVSLCFQAGFGSGRGERPILDALNFWVSLIERDTVTKSEVNIQWPYNIHVLFNTLNRTDSGALVSSVAKSVLISVSQVLP